MPFKKMRKTEAGEGMAKKSSSVFSDLAMNNHHSQLQGKRSDHFNFPFSRFL